MQMENLKNLVVFFEFYKDLKEDFSSFDLKGKKMLAVVSGIEQNGIWIEHPRYEFAIWWDGKGGIIPKEKRKKEKFKANIFIPWNYIKGIMCIRDERFKKPNIKAIGFSSYK